MGAVLQCMHDSDIRILGGICFASSNFIMLHFCLPLCIYLEVQRTSFILNADFFSFGHLMAPEMPK